MRTAGWSLLLAVALLPGACLLALLAPGVSFDWPVSMVSDLGARTCFAADGRWICSPHAAAFDLALVLCGALLGCAGLSLLPGRGRPGEVPGSPPGAWSGGEDASIGPAASASSADSGPWFRAALLCAGLGLVVLGLFPSDSLHGVHMIGAVLALPGTAAGLSISGLRGELPGTGARPRLRAVLGLLALLGTLTHVAPHWRVQGAAEVLSLGSLLVLLGLEAVALLRAAGSRGG